MQNKYIQLPERGERRRIQIQDPRLQTKIISLKEVRKSKREKKTPEEKKKGVRLGGKLGEEFTVDRLGLVFFFLTKKIRK